VKAVPQTSTCENDDHTYGCIFVKGNFLPYLVAPEKPLFFRDRVGI
jgi:hypothetical protein